MITMVRVDDRLVHAQVVVGWLSSTRATRIVVVDDDVAQDPEREDLFRMVLPDDVSIEVLDMESAVARWKAIESSKDLYLVLFANPVSLDAAVAGGILPKEVNIGGMHESPDRRPWEHGLYATSAEIAAIRRMMQVGIGFEYRAVPAAKRRLLGMDGQ